MPVRERGRSFLADLMVKGERHRATFSSRAEAESWEHSVKAALAMGRPVPAPHTAQEPSKRSVPTIIEMVRTAERKHWKHKKAGATLARYAYLFADYVGRSMPLDVALSEEMIEDYLTYREDLGNSGSTINRYRASISKVCTLAMRDGYLTARPHVRARKEGTRRMRVYSREEEMLLIHTALQWGYQDQAHLFMWLCDTAMRLGEVEKLCWADIEKIDSGRTVVHIPADITKNSEARYIVLTKRAAEILERLRLDPRATIGPFCWHHRRTTRGIWDRLRGHFEWMDDQCVLHTWRHTCASRLVQNGASLYHVQRMLGHKTITMTQRYAHFAPRNMEELADLLDSRYSNAHIHTNLS